MGIRRLLVPLALVVAASSLGQVQDRVIRSHRNGWWTVSIHYPVLKGATPFVQAANAALLADARQAYAKGLQQMREAGPEKPQREMVLERTVKLGFLRPSLASFTAQSYCDFGGAHPNSWPTGLVVGQAKDGIRLLKIQDVLRPGASWQDLVPTVESAADDMRKARVGERVREFYEDAFTKPEEVGNFIVDAQGITFLYGPYDLGSYAEGEYDVAIPWVKIEPWIDSSGPLAVAMGKK